MQLNILHLTKQYANGVKALDDVSLQIGNPNLDEPEPKRFK